MEPPNSMNESWKIQNEVSALGFDWPDIKGVLIKVREEVAEIEEALLKNDKTHAREELGDLFFATVNLARFLDVHPCDAMQSANEKFRRRFASVEEIISTRNIDMESCSLEELDAVWDEVKRAESDGKK
ncbi:MAG: MazG nucleotide pyrophosphohydrolase domain-containing protein [Candidatus Hydrogenedentota bacterium]